MYIPRNWEFGSALAKLRNGGRGGGLNPPKTTPFGTPLLFTACMIFLFFFKERFIAPIYCTDLHINLHESYKIVP
jgi:hypothetical protein